MCGIWQLFLKQTLLTKNTIEKYKTLFNNVKIRGPDMSSFIVNNNNIIGFHRLAINGLSVEGMQPFTFETDTHKYTLTCNGEIYNFKELENKLSKIYDYKPLSQSDCEVLLPFLNKVCDDNVEEMLNHINGEFAIIITKTNKATNEHLIYLSTDPLSVRPMFYQEIESNGLLISSLLKGMDDSFENVRLLQGELRTYKFNDQLEFLSSKIYHNYVDKNLYNDEENMELYKHIVETLFNAVRKRLMSDRPLCCLLSGGLDSSLVAAIAQRLIKEENINNTLHTFTIGMEDGSDLKYGKMVADYIGSNHTVVNILMEDALNELENIVYVVETYDITTIRASTFQNLLAKYISENTDFKVVLNGDGSDEVTMGYLYYYLHPSFEEAQADSLKLITNISKYDGLRVDRNISHYGLEARVPFLDKEFVNLYVNIGAKLKVPMKDRMEKYLLRKAFDVVFKDDPILPRDVLWRKKEAFSDGVSKKEKSWYVMTQEYAKIKISDEEFISIQSMYKDHLMPYTHESAYYRKIFEQHFKNGHKNTPYYWLPNWSKSNDPSARTLQVYNE
jgi:asparagine synthase (glutamine-hydrolysing)